MSWLDAVPDLLDAARGTLRETVLPAVAAERRYDALMLGNALGIAVRELRQGGEARAEERAEIAALLGEPAADLPALRRHLCRAIRDGSLAADRPELRSVLLAAVRRRLAISNPDHLARLGS